ncbi:hypothetical protein PTSG_13012 [Salpingoeca rosetta]|uniref:Uncharacterized protein n=1 Tax=Salpingoeca rosetta (strain ATCC 50818 / BSB-021) TaxID=946362 RepID=F2UQS5_SALR5|nr:uncharacterized protein PTSG_13012 [Salpingoeca rosetta]EGD79980.1 hypothetical protein PTSG_13012 [Salpingoeca rosetta]|eukprot:XP_004988601.1 hypothetical protein PTSG_13012 [Salpingoeca rosetta]
MAQHGDVRLLTDLLTGSPSTLSAAVTAPPDGDPMTSVGAHIGVGGGGGGGGGDDVMKPKPIWPTAKREDSTQQHVKGINGGGSGEASTGFLRDNAARNSNAGTRGTIWSSLGHGGVARAVTAYPPLQKRGSAPSSLSSTETATATAVMVDGGGAADKEDAHRITQNVDDGGDDGDGGCGTERYGAHHGFDGCSLVDALDPIATRAFPIVDNTSTTANSARSAALPTQQLSSPRASPPFLRLRMTQCRPFAAVDGPTPPVRYAAATAVVVADGRTTDCDAPTQRHNDDGCGGGDGGDGGGDGGEGGDGCHSQHQHQQEGARSRQHRANPTTPVMVVFGGCARNHGGIDNTNSTGDGYDDVDADAWTGGPLLNDTWVLCNTPAAPAQSSSALRWYHVPVATTADTDHATDAGSDDDCDDDDGDDNGGGDDEHGACHVRGDNNTSTGNGENATCDDDDSDTTNAASTRQTSSADAILAELDPFSSNSVAASPRSASLSSSHTGPPPSSSQPLSTSSTSRGRAASMPIAYSANATDRTRNHQLPTTTTTTATTTTPIPPTTTTATTTATSTPPPAAAAAATATTAAATTDQVSHRHRHLAPSPRLGAACIFKRTHDNDDAGGGGGGGGDGVLIVFGGRSGARLKNDVWILKMRSTAAEPATWQRCTQVGTTAPPARYLHTMAAVSSGFVVFGGRDRHASLGDAWMAHVDVRSMTVEWRLLCTDGPALHFWYKRMS